MPKLKQLPFRIIGLSIPLTLFVACSSQTISRTPINPTLEMIETPPIQASLSSSPYPTTELTATAHPTEDVHSSAELKVIDDQLSTEIGLEYYEHPEVSSTYLLVINHSGTADDGTGSKYQIEFIAADGSIKGKFLEINDSNQSIDYAYFTQDINRDLFLVDFDEKKINITRVDLDDKVSESFTIDAAGQIPDSNRFIKVGEKPNYAFSPNGQWFVWRCDQDAIESWCLIDLATVAGWKINRSFASQSMVMTSNLVWSPSSDWFMDTCAKRDFENQITFCFIYPREHTVEEWELDSWSASTFPYLFESNDISENGETFVNITSSNNNEMTFREVNLINRTCKATDNCGQNQIYSVANPSRIDALWSSTQSLIAVDFNLYQSEYSNESGPGHIIVIENSNEDPKIITDNTPPGAKVIAWSPSNEWFALHCGDRQDYVLCSVSKTGELFYLVPKVSNSFSNFLGWYIVP